MCKTGPKVNRSEAAVALDSVITEQLRSLMTPAVQPCCALKHSRWMLTGNGARSKSQRSRSLTHAQPVESTGDLILLQVLIFIYSWINLCFLLSRSWKSSWNCGSFDEVKKWNASTSTFQWSKRISCHCLSADFQFSKMFIQDHFYQNHVYPDSVFSIIFRQLFGLIDNKY